MSNDIQINTKETSDYGGTPFDIKVGAEVPLDPLSKAFKKYTHTIKYTGGGYEPYKYSISVYTKGSYTYVFRLLKSYQKFEHVEVYFGFSHNISTEDPLILGFIYGSNRLYYTYKHLTSVTPKARFLSHEGKIDKKDLITRLLEEIGPRIDRQKKLVISLDEGPTAGNRGGLREFKYPDSGFFKEHKRITVTKVDVKGGLIGYNKYEHTVPSIRDVNVQDFYVTYENNSRFFKVAATSGSGYASLKKVTAYYENSTTGVARNTANGINSANSKRLVFITFSLTNGSTYEYPYYEFVKELKTVTAAKKWDTDSRIIVGRSGGLTSINAGRDGDVDSKLITRLPIESKRLKQMIFETDDDSSRGSNDNIKEDKKYLEGQDGVGPDYKFIKVVMEPKTDESKDGPPKVYNSRLFDGYEEGRKIQPEGVLKGIATSTSGNGYHSITVYYSPEVGNKYKALLVEFNDYDIKTYIKRVNEEGTKWAYDTAGISTKDDYELVLKLHQQRERFRPLIEFKNGDGLDDRGDNQHITTDGPDDIYGQSVDKGYKFQKFTMKPNTSDGSGGKGNSSGPWTVYCTKLFSGYDSVAKIQTEVLTRKDIVTGDVTSSTSSKYKSITVYYIVKNTRDYKALLVEFVRVGGTSTTSNKGIRGTGEAKIYFRRIDYHGNTWDDALGEDTSDNKKLVQKLTNIAMNTSIIERGDDISSEIPGGNGDNSTTGVGEAVGGTVAGIGGAGAGFAIYKYHGVLLSLIKR